MSEWQQMNAAANCSQINMLNKNETLSSDVNHSSPQFALANLLNSLTNLTNNNQSQQLIVPNEVVVASSTQIMQQHQQQHQTQPNSSNASLALTSSLQSVVAAAMMQQQLAASSAQLSPPPTASRTAPTAPNNGGYLDGSLIASEDRFFGYDPQNHLRNAHQHQQQQQQQQRINYCTICNKELCNKYFMKTHMLKMHGINLEMEQQNDQQQQQQENGSDDGDESDESEKWSQPNQLVEASNGHQKSSSKKASIKGNAQEKSTINGQQQQQQQQTQKATSVMNGFAGNSMGGVVCDICNKELCSKYFLKVHKQNTHGIVTDYQDSTSLPFVYPFATAPPSAFMQPFGHPHQQPNPLGAFFVGHHTNGGPQSMMKGPIEPLVQSSSTNKTAPKRSHSGSKRARLSSSQQQRTTVIDEDAGMNSSSKQPLDASNVYRLMLAQKQQQPQQQQQQMLDPMGAMMCLASMNPAGPFALSPAGMSPAMIVDNILRNQHLFNRTTTNIGGGGNQALGKKTTDKNNNNKSDATAKSTTTTNSNGKSQTTTTTTSSNNNKQKEQQNGNRYFSHYTEACPMCERRFKSIKWLKTHMMNDHKQEIGAYMQMMMQYLYASKSQQVAATMAALERHGPIHGASYPDLACQRQLGSGQEAAAGSSLLLANRFLHLPASSICTNNQQQQYQSPVMNQTTTTNNNNNNFGGPTLSLDSSSSLFPNAPIESQLDQAQDFTIARQEESLSPMSSSCHSSSNRAQQHFSELGLNLSDLTNGENSQSQCFNESIIVADEPEDDDDDDDDDDDQEDDEDQDERHSNQQVASIDNNSNQQMIATTKG